jgi:hypothetical protein
MRQKARDPEQRWKGTSTHATDFTIAKLLRISQTCACSLPLCGRYMAPLVRIWRQSKRGKGHSETNAHTNTQMHVERFWKRRKTDAYVDTGKRASRRARNRASARRFNPTVCGRHGGNDNQSVTVNPRATSTSTTKSANVNTGTKLS